MKFKGIVSLDASLVNPALKHFTAQLECKFIFAQVSIARCDCGYELRHVSDHGISADLLRAMTLSDLRALAQFTETGAFRPLKSAPTLRRGWRLEIASDVELQIALDHLYPGAVADWHAAQSPTPPLTHFREFTNRQTGMYRLTQMFTDSQAAQTITACCHQNFCLKRRRWTVEGLAPDRAEDKSCVPCLEPCALLLEFARKAMRIEQQEKVTVALALDELATLTALVDPASARASSLTREGDFNSPANPRRAQLVLDKLKPVMNVGAAVDTK